MAKAKTNKPSSKNTLTEITENKYAVYLLLALFMLLVFLGSSYKISGDDDLFWHLATGRYVVQNVSVPDKDVFGHITSGQEWIPFEWGWDVLTYGLFNLGGYNAILVFRSFAFCFIFLMLYMLLRKFKVNSVLSILMMFILLVAIMDRLSPRPHILTYIFFVLLINILLRYKYFEKEKYSKYLYAIPIIFLLWANSHMGVLAGGLVLFVFILTETIIYFKPGSFSSSGIRAPDKNDLRNLWIISIVSALVLLVNPHGISTYMYAYNHTKMKMLETVNEWQNPFASKMDLGFTLSLYKYFLFAGILVLYYAWKKKDLLFALMFIAFAVYSVRAIRFTVDYDIVMFVFIVISISYIISNIKSISFRNIYNGLIPKAALGLFFIYILIQLPSGKIYEDIKYYRPYGWGIDAGFFPMQLIDFMKENKISGTPLNHFGTGGLLVWNFPEQKNFIDSRNLNDEIFTEYNSVLGMRPGFEKKLEERGVDYVLYLDPDLIRRPGDLKTIIVNYLSNNSGWKLVFWDDRSLLYVKDIPKFQELISKYQYKVFEPYSALFNMPLFEKRIKDNPDIARNEINRMAAIEPDGYFFRNLNAAALNVLDGK